MLVGVMSTAAAAIVSGANNPDSTEVGAGNVGDSVQTGWCDIAYNEDGVVVVLTPDKEALLNITKDQLKSIINLMIDAAKEVVINDLKSQISNSLLPDNSGSLDASGVTADNLWNMAIDGYIGDNYTSEENIYIEFFKAAVNDPTNAVINGFIDYAIDLMKSAVSLGLITVDDLPSVEEADELGEKLTEIFNT